MNSPLKVRPLQAADAEALAGAFSEMGWDKPATQFSGYLEEETTGRRSVVVADWEGAVAGYVSILWESHDPVFRAAGIPEINDLNVLEKYRGRGIGNALMEFAEGKIAERQAVAGLSVGLHQGFGSAQRLYALRGYVPDGAGAVLDGVAVPEGATIRLDDRPVIRMTKRLK